MAEEGKECVLKRESAVETREAGRELGTLGVRYRS